MFKLFILIFLFSGTTLAEVKSDVSTTVTAPASKKEVKVKFLGTFLYLSSRDRRNIYGFEYYILVTDKDGKKFAYPVEFRIKKLEKNINKFVNRHVLARGLLIRKKIFVGETQREISVFQAEQAGLINAGQLGVSGPVNTNLRASGTEMGGQDVDRRVGANIVINGINDTVTNAIIFSAGAALLGSMLK